MGGVKKQGVSPASPIAESDSQLSPVSHAKRRLENRPIKIRRLMTVGFFDGAYHLRMNPGAAVGWGAAPSLHYEMHGRFEGRGPNAGFSEAYYLSQYPDVAAAVRAGPLAPGCDRRIGFGPGRIRFPDGRCAGEAVYRRSQPDAAAGGATAVAGAVPPTASSITPPAAGRRGATRFAATARHGGQRHAGRDRGGGGRTGVNPVRLPGLSPPRFRPPRFRPHRRRPPRSRCRASGCRPAPGRRGWNGP